MKRNSALCTIAVFTTVLTGCGAKETPDYYASYSSTTPYFQDQQYYASDSFPDYPQAERRMGSEKYYEAPPLQHTSHKDMDSHWVSQQNPSGFTVEVLESEKASQVASVLYKAPKTNRMAEVRSSRGGKTYYKGVYGSYSSFEEAQKALNNLPSEIKQGASIKNWSKVQTDLSN
ncbi:MAG: SPOR domain-containing protein [Tatlockia sp.]|jgi:septal ring-binding cell division protein DamX